MLIGYNTNVSYKGKVYHVQTEDTGPGKLTLVTLLYHQGAILHSRKTSYADILGRPDFEERLRGLMKEQHKGMIKALLSGRLVGGPATGEAPEVPSAEPLPVAPSAHRAPAGAAEQQKAEQRVTRSLDEILLEHISRKVKDR